MKPTVGRIVHYYPDAESDYAGEGPIPAIITKVTSLNGVFSRVEEAMYRVQIHPFHPGLPFHLDALFTQQDTEGHWAWPPRE